MTEERLQKTLARAGLASRRGAEDLIREGRVTIDGRVAELGDQVDLEYQAVKVDGKRVTAPSAVRSYVVVNKPRAVVSTLDDPEGRPTVIELVPIGRRRGLKPIGRLDYDSEGLLLLTNDGEFAQKISHPKNGCIKTYEVKVKGRPDESSLEKLRRGIVLDGRRTAPARLESMRVSGARDSKSNSWWRVQIGEGRKRQIREMFFRVGHPVQRLRRVGIGGFVDPNLLPGDWRDLSEDEVDALRHNRGGPSRRSGPPKRRSDPSKSSRDEASKGPRSKPASQRSGKPSGRSSGKPAGKRSGGRSDTRADGRGGGGPRRGPGGSSGRGPGGSGGRGGGARGGRRR